MRTDICDGRLWIRQAKTNKLIGVAIEGQLADVIQRPLTRPSPAGNVATLHLVRNAKGEPLGYAQLRRMFEQARTAAGVHFQLRNLRAKSATDETDLFRANERQGHSTMGMTKHYRRANKVGPLR
ncbi:hypothetical protein JHS3_03420 [Jeongeupia sp. HS-3]|uniref:tyrosine-type recombinase/integrase n=1 Tax=Jeongeupia sp. HS-3 TaxID=1009682 RepID=UPI0018A546A9|nr:tyrosine-type recombinase/integrase [Jeongeupia sp. HS-3]BCL74606.1 hypothetical protein JHS3_03420 [Jeongeupia sp. HS-3]